jgi:integrase
MRGHILQRYEGSWSIIIEAGRAVNPTTGRLKRVQKWLTIRGTKKEAEAKLAELLHRLNRGQVVEPSRMTLGEWLDEWLESAIRSSRRIRTYETYRSVISRHLKPKLGQIRLCDLRASHLQQYYNGASLSKATLQQHHAILHGALKTALRQDLVLRNVADLVEGKPRAQDIHKDAIQHCWEDREARAFLSQAKAAGSQPAAFYSLALDSGARKAELCGLQWRDLDLETATMSLVRQLVRPGLSPLFGPPKNGQARTIALSLQTVALLKKHKAIQAAQRLELGTAYRDFGLVFAKPFGEPLQSNNLGQREYRKLIQAAGVRPIKFHGLRHTCATLLLKSGVHIKVASERLGHKKIEMTLDIYAHALPSMQQEAATKMGAVLHG